MSSGEWLRYAASSFQIIKDIELATLSAEITGKFLGLPEEELVEQWELNQDLSCAADLIRRLDARGQSARDMALMARLLAACYGCRRSAADIAVALADRLYRYGLMEDFRERQRLVRYVLGWVAVAAGSVDISTVDDPVELVAQAGQRVLEKLARDAGAEASRKERGLRLDGVSAEIAAAAIAGFADNEAAKNPCAPEEMVVLAGVAAGTGGRESKEVGSDFDSINGELIELVQTPDLGPIRTTLVAEFPYAVSVIDALLGDLVGNRSIRMRPTLLVGEPGCGKSRLLRRLCEELDLPAQSYPCGGQADSAIAGTARRWSSTEPSLPLRLVRDREVANPCIILDEVDKASPNSGYGGRLWDVLMAWFEFETSARWTDPYVSTEVDLSAVVWLATANDARCLPDPLLDRMRVLRMPEPRREDLPALANAMLIEAARASDMGSRWVEEAPLAPYEIEGLRRVWKQGSLRSLRRLVEGVLAARDQSMPRA